MEAPETEALTENPRLKPEMEITIVEDGPYIVKGGVPLREQVITHVDGHYEFRDGRPLPQAETYALCRCGRSSNPPFCDGSHLTSGFDGTETASRMPYKSRAEVFVGEEANLLDDGRCAFARFCHRDLGDVWTLTQDIPGKKAFNEAVKASSQCPSGRLVHVDREGNYIEPDTEPEIIVMQDPEKGASSGLFVKGGIPLVSADGTQYERRNRYALCRCGVSRNKPFCDATHVSIQYQA